MYDYVIFQFDNKRQIKLRITEFACHVMSSVVASDTEQNVFVPACENASFTVKSLNLASNKSQGISPN